MMVVLIMLALSGLVVGLFKAIADIVDHVDTWSSSVFAKKGISSFWGSKDFTWRRKDHPNKVIDWLLHGPLVMFTDIWHFANAVRVLGFTFALIGMYYYNGFVGWGLLAYYVPRQVSFNLFYHLVLRRKEVLGEIKEEDWEALDRYNKKLDDNYWKSN
jgi:hypothetical protein